ncbi:hypothetical protein ACFQZ2_03785 [Streptomonospora algeriensis]|uniref:Uncharacterized protein n=1 Tax=Streptomonospora algeriensis TaxID=995084 RepID=A0ABW3BF67_9ACTN
MFVNLPVSDLRTSVDFFAGLGSEFDPSFTDENDAAMIIGENALVMLLSKYFFQSFAKKGTADTGASAEAIVSVSANVREEVDEKVGKALSTGGRPAAGRVDRVLEAAFGVEDGSTDAIAAHRWAAGHPPAVAVVADPGSCAAARRVVVCLAPAGPAPAASALRLPSPVINPTLRVRARRPDFRRPRCPCNLPVCVLCPVFWMSTRSRVPRCCASFGHRGVRMCGSNVAKVKIVWFEAEKPRPNMVLAID